MNCKCGGSSNVIDSRKRVDKMTGVEYTHRRKICNECLNRFSVIEADADVIKRLLRLESKVRGLYASVQ